MKFLLLFIIIAIGTSCSKTNTTTTPPPPTDTGSVYISSITIKDINTADISYGATQPSGENYTSANIIWSTTPDFSGATDSVGVMTGIATHQLTRLGQLTKYYVRIGVTLRGRRIYSAPKDFTTLELKVLSVGYYDPPRGFSKDDTTVIFTNLPGVSPGGPTDTKVFFGSYECIVTSDQGLTVSFNVPVTIPVGKYKFKLVTRGMEAGWKDSVEVLRGLWNFIPNPNIPGNPAASYSALVNYSTCYSAQKGYIIGGGYLNGPPVGFPNSQWPEYLLEFDGTSKTWSKRTISNPHYYENAHCYYYGNAIYVVAAHQYTYNMLGTHGMSLKKIHRLDLNSLVWTELQDVPYPKITNMATFQINNEFYMGMGADSANRTVCCGTPIPAKKFWKYNPASGAFTALADFPGDHQSFPTCFSINGKGYAFYGAIPVGDVNTTVTFKKELWEYDPALNSWRQIALPATGGPPAGEKYQITTYNGKAYFISAQVREVYGLGYGFRAFNPCLEWDPVSNTYTKVAFPFDNRILKNFYQQGNKFYYQSHSTGYFDSTPFTAFTFEIEQ